jgi:glycine oxidase
MESAVIIGAGIIGSSIALELQRRGTKAILLEKAVIGAESSSAAAGMLSPQTECHAPDPTFELGLYSRRLYPAYVSRIRELSKLDVGYHVDGGLQPASTPAALEHMIQSTAWQRGRDLRIETLSSEAARKLVPGLHQEIAGALFYPDEGQVDPRLLMRALSVATRAAGVEHVTSTTVRRILIRNGGVSGVELTDRVLESDRIIVAAGAWSPLIEGTGIPARAVQPARGQMIALDCGTPPFLPYVVAENGYLVPRRDGRVLVGATVELAGFEKAVTAGGMLQLLDAAVSTVPALADARVVETWSGLRPWTIDQLPILGPAPIRGLYHATGHYRNGILQAPATAALIADLVTGERPQLDLSPFRVERFSET